MKQKRTIIIAVIVVLLALIGGMAVYMLKVTGEDVYFTGVHVESLDMSGLTKEEAKDKFDTYWNSLLAT